MSVFEMKHHQFPTGKTYVRFTINGEGVGLAYVVKGGYLGHNKRKPVPTMEEAARQFLVSAVKRKRKELAQFEAALAELQPVKVAR